ncbi:30S ribosome-binding factor RbfA [Arsenicicoccus sp. oral taxon 190]|uniref:30S ribosome-binding factor RbfA n=1 Tax=Arsenicicoccus sp. oral taxon 190 TaxID=1658671 RepID=UPI0009E526AD|nr:30S ribosome-binding factor RbfA [Arsenicicoccus sp. oral taxon 190]
MADPARARKIADRIKVVAAEYLEHRLKDERLGFITLTDVRVTGDLQHATVFYTVFGSDEERAATAEAVQDNLGRIRSHVGKALGIRLTPSLEFVADALPETSSQLEEALRKARERDQELAAQRAQAAYAGDADPYKKPAEAEAPAEPADDAHEAERDDTVDGYAPVPPPASVRDGGVDAEEAAQLEDVAALDLTDQDQDAAQGTGRADG